MCKLCICAKCVCAFICAKCVCICMCMYMCKICMHLKNFLNLLRKLQYNCSCFGKKVINTNNIHAKLCCGKTGYMTVLYMCLYIEKSRIIWQTIKSRYI